MTQRFPTISEVDPNPSEDDPKITEIHPRFSNVIGGSANISDSLPRLCIIIVWAFLAKFEQELCVVLKIRLACTGGFIFALNHLSHLSGESRHINLVPRFPLASRKLAQKKSGDEAHQSGHRFYDNRHDGFRIIMKISHYVGINIGRKTIFGESACPNIQIYVPKLYMSVRY